MNSVPKVLELNRLADDRFAPHHPEDDPEGWNVVFSGQLLAQMIMAVDAVVEGALDVKSIQTIFSPTAAGCSGARRSPPIKATDFSRVVSRS